MRSGARLRGLRSVASALVVLVALGPGRALAYRPFVSTDAAVAEPGEVEIELGSGFRERHGDGTVVAPTVIANLGLLRDVELVVETKASHDLAARGDRSQAEDTDLPLPLGPVSSSTPPGASLKSSRSKTGRSPRRQASPRPSNRRAADGEELGTGGEV